MVKTESAEPEPLGTEPAKTATPLEDIGLTVFLVVLIVCLFVLFPMIPASGLGKKLTSVGFSFILISGVLIVVPRHGLRVLALVLGLLAATTEWLGHVIVHDGLRGTGHLFTTTFLALPTYCLFIQILRPGRVTFHRVRGAMAIYLLLGLIWAQAYALVDLAVPGSFEPPVSHDSSISESSGIPSRLHPMPELVYFSYVTLTTLGYGDIVPRSGPARSLAILEALVGQLFVAVLVARLVSLEIAHSMNQDL